MRRMMPLTIVVLLLMQTVALNLVVPAQAASGRGGTNDDFTVKTIAIGNSSEPAEQWVQSDGTVMNYIFMEETIEVTITSSDSGPPVSEKNHPFPLTSFTRLALSWRPLTTPRLH